MKTRIITAIVGIALLVPLLIFSDTYFFVAGVGLLSAVGVVEMLRCVGGLHKKWALTLPMLAFAILIPFALRFWGVEAVSPYLTLALISAVLYVLAFVVFAYGKNDVSGVGTAFLGCLYVIAGFSSIIYLRDIDGGKIIYLLVFIGAWVTDTFAYFTGMLLGKHKLIPAVSPKKTVEGSIGGMVACMIAFFLFGLFFIENEVVPLYWLPLMGLIVSVVSQIGDLAMSVIKRQYGIKDYGKLFPGHGGVLDRFDSILAVSVVLAVMMFVAERIW